MRRGHCRATGCAGKTKRGDLTSSLKPLQPCLGSGCAESGNTGRRLTGAYGPRSLNSVVHRGFHAITGIFSTNTTEEADDDNDSLSGDAWEESLPWQIIVSEKTEEETYFEYGRCERP